MAIPEKQLDTWANQGAMAGSRDTYKSVKTALESTKALYNGQDYTVFLQGSYGNDTNIFAESDVDVVIQLNSALFLDLEALTQADKDALNATMSDAKYGNTQFKKDVVTRLTTEYGDAAKAGDKAITIAAEGNRRKSDVIAAATHRRYFKNSSGNLDYYEGITFFTAGGQQINNFPRHHSDNLTTKHQNTKNWLKPMARILKNMRGKLVDDGMIEAGLAPSYYLEGLLYNVPDDKFGSSYADTFANAINWIRAADRSKFVCANERYYLLRDGSPVTWQAEKCDKFLTAAVKLWNDW
ncbi:MAG: nucleotidyltransferase [Rhodospirillaceae bacterium]|nr:nucleotidyltransferase [Rhodospirillaceae bacterium]